MTPDGWTPRPGTLTVISSAHTSTAEAYLDQRTRTARTRGAPGAVWSLGRREPGPLPGPWVRHLPATSLNLSALRRHLQLLTASPPDRRPELLVLHTPNALGQTLEDRDLHLHAVIDLLPELLLLGTTQVLVSWAADTAQTLTVQTTNAPPLPPRVRAELCQDVAEQNPLLLRRRLRLNAHHPDAVHVWSDPQEHGILRTLHTRPPHPCVSSSNSTLHLLHDPALPPDLVAPVLAARLNLEERGLPERAALTATLGRWLTPAEAATALAEWWAGNPAASPLSPARNPA